MFVYLQYLSLKNLLFYIIYRFCYNCCFYKNNFGFKEYVNSNCLNLFFRYFVNICLVNFFSFIPGFPKVSQTAPFGVMTDIQVATSSKGARGGAMFSVFCVILEKTRINVLKMRLKVFFF